LWSTRSRSVGSADGLEVDRPDTPGPAGVRADGGGRDDAGHEALDGRLLAGIEACAVDPDPPADLQVPPAHAGGQVDRDEIGPDDRDLRPGARSWRALRVGPRDRIRDLASLHAADSLPS